MTALITLALGLAAGIPLGARLRLRLLCSPTCRKDGVWLWTPEQELAVWERGAGNGVAYKSGELAGTPMEDRIWRMLTGRRARITDTDEDRVAA